MRKCSNPAILPSRRAGSGTKSGHAIPWTGARLKPAVSRPLLRVAAGGSRGSVLTTIGDAVYRLLAPRLRDAFAEAGVGWGNTITNDFPFARIDQIWIDPHWRPRAVQAQRSAHSDHRIVIADLTLVEL